MTPPAIFLTDLAGVVVAWHPTAERLFGLAWVEVAGAFLGSFWSLEGLEPDTMPIRFSRRRRFDFDGWLARRRGEPFWASGFTTPLLDDAGIAAAFAVFTVDGTERRHVRLRLRHLAGLEGPGAEGLRPFGLTDPMLRWAGDSLGTRVHEAER
jgi:PAS domain S-box-containing protein